MSAETARNNAPRRRRYHERFGLRDAAERKGPNSTSSRSANLPRPVNGWGLFRPNIQIIASAMGSSGHFAFFGQSPKCELAHTSFRLAPPKSGMATSIWRQEGTLRLLS